MLFTEQRLKHYRLPIVILLLLGFMLVLWQVAHWTRNNELGTLQRALELNLSRYTLSLKGELEKYQNLPALLATDRSFKEVLYNPRNRVVSETPKNDASTRSHCIFIIFLPISLRFDSSLGKFVTQN